MVSAFQTLGRAGVSDPSILAENINVALLSAVAGLLAAGVGVILLVIATILHFTDWPKKVDSTLVTEKH